MTDDLQEWLDAQNAARRKMISALMRESNELQERRGEAERSFTERYHTWPYVGFGGCFRQRQEQIGGEIYELVELILSERVDRGMLMPRALMPGEVSEFLGKFVPGGAAGQAGGE